VSTARQGQSGLGLDAQDAAIQSYRDAGACDLKAIYTEVESGKRADRPELIRAIAHAKRAKATLVIAKLDRLSRNVAFVANLLESGVEFVACDNPHANRLTIHILAAMAEHEAKVIGERTKAALGAYKARGGKLGTDNLTTEGRTLGQRRSGEKARRDADAAYSDLTVGVKALRAEGLTLRAIAEQLNSDGQTTRRGKQWNASQVSRVLDRAGG
jgi:DNA invertase Pin-like site-specific DNA recombinase